MFDKMRKDYRRHGASLLNPALWAVWNYRYGQAIDKMKIAPFRWILSKFYGFNMFVILVNSGIRLYKETKTGEDLHLIHSGNINIHPRAVIGDRCGIQHDVTIGINMEKPGVPVIGDDVFIGTGAKILGPVTIGNGAVIGANSVVIKDVPPNATAIGVPARILRYNGKKED